MFRPSLNPKTFPRFHPLAAVILLLFLAGTGCIHKLEPQLLRYEFERPEMGLPFRIVLYAATPEIARNASERAFERIKSLNAIYSDYEYDSELSALSRSAGSGKWVPVSRDLWRVLTAAQLLSRQSEGAFDVTVGPYVTLWKKARREKKLPTAAHLRDASDSVGYAKLEFDARSRAVLPRNKFMRLDLGGIAKGYALDAALQELKDAGLRHALVVGGGDMAVGDPPPGLPGWHIALAPLDAPDAPPVKFVSIHNCGMATSGDLFQRVEIDGVRYSHIVDPRTGIGLTDHSLVTVIAPRCGIADPLTKAMSILPLDKAAAILRKYPGCAARIVRKPGAAAELHELAGFEKYYERPAR